MWCWSPKPDGCVASRAEARAKRRAVRILALETSTRRASIALVEDDRLVSARIHEEPHTHAERIVPLLDEAMGEAGWAKTSLDLIACGIGPGSFTGVRIALATGKGIALALGCPIIGIGSLRAMAAGIGGEHRQAPVIPLIDARKGEVFWAVYDGGGEELRPPEHVARAALPELIRDDLARGAFVVGEIASEIGIEEASIHRSFSSDLPDAFVIAKLAAARARKGDFDSLDALEPAYVRPPDIYPQLSPPRILRP